MGRMGEVAAGERDLFSAPRSATGDRPDGIPTEICDLFENLALEVSRLGRKRYSADAIAHRLRWHFHIERNQEDFKLNNNSVAVLSRWFLKRHPELPNFFELRRSKHDEDHP